MFGALVQWYGSLGYRLALEPVRRPVGGEDLVQAAFCMGRQGFCSLRRPVRTAPRPAQLIQAGRTLCAGELGAVYSRRQATGRPGEPCPAHAPYPAGWRASCGVLSSSTRRRPPLGTARSAYPGSSRRRFVNHIRATKNKWSGYRSPKGGFEGADLRIGHAKKAGYYPDSKKWAVDGNVFRMEAAKYYDGEE